MKLSFLLLLVLFPFFISGGYSTFENVLFIDYRESNLNHIKRKGRTVTHVFNVKNITDSTIYILAARANCDCVSVAWDKSGIPSDSWSKIKVSYRQKKDSGNFDRTVTLILSGVSKPLLLRIRD